jgi:2-desacetyl-2-hydroxyethyl bacteriochlorophyllide A dehydrogenase
MDGKITKEMNMIKDNRAALYVGNRTITVDIIDRPIPKTNEVLVEVAYCGICGTDLHIFQGHMDKRVTLPHVMGHEASGRVVEAPAGSGFKTGDRVTVEPTAFCGKCSACNQGFSHVCYKLNFIGIDSPGAFQRFWSVRLDRVHKIPDSLPDDIGALVEPLAVAVHDVRRANVQSADRVAVIGGGPIGILIAMVARHKGANVVLLEINEYRLSVARELGFDTVNSKTENAVESIMSRTDGEGADIVFEVTGSKPAAAMMTELARVRGTISIVGVFNASEPPPVNLHRFFWRELHLHGSRVYEGCDFKEAISLAASGAIPLEKLISGKVTFHTLGNACVRLLGGEPFMKILVDCQKS